jgi:hypothetical protein
LALAVAALVKVVDTLVAAGGGQAEAGVAAAALEGAMRALVREKEMREEDSGMEEGDESDEEEEEDEESEEGEEREEVRRSRGPSGSLRAVKITLVCICPVCVARFDDLLCEVRDPEEDRAGKRGEEA